MGPSTPSSHWGSLELFPADSAHPPSSQSGAWDARLFSLSSSQAQQTSPRRLTSDLQAFSMLAPACKYFSLAPSASSPSLWGTDLEIGSWALSVSSRPVFPTASSDSKSHSIAISPGTASTCLAGTYPASAQRGSLVGCLPGMFQRRAAVG
ncbi:hypothetical protein HJG60_009273 [Phyllostomus discolor]|uniref:Uncharacterized protein n=1 Tax=Phyllostomus discolor TaxID=89673 RepID=A0A833YMK2_9CHIR|nr:hypothetical protein HJG60_009273 [Phyllostomus discolor]